MKEEVRVCMSPRQGDLPLIFWDNSPYSPHPGKRISYEKQLHKSNPVKQSEPPHELEKRDMYGKERSNSPPLPVMGWWASTYFANRLRETVSSLSSWFPSQWRSGCIIKLRGGWWPDLKYESQHQAAKPRKTETGITNCAQILGATRSGKVMLRKHVRL